MRSQQWSVLLYIKGFVFRVNQIHRLRRIGLDCACRIINPTACNKKSVELSAPVGRLGLPARSTTQHSSSSSPRVRLCGVGCAFASCSLLGDPGTRLSLARVHCDNSGLQSGEQRTDHPGALLPQTVSLVEQQS